MEQEWLKLGVLGLVVLSQSLALRKLYADLQEAHEARDVAREEALATLERVLTKLDSKSSKNNS